MRYSILGKTGLRVSVLGFGCMRLPEKDGRVVRELSTPLLRRAVELGINYFDTAIDYCHGDSQAAVGEALEGVRSRIILSAKNHHHRAGKAEWRRHLEESLRLLRTDYIDMYSHHGISWDTYRKYLDPEKNGLTREMLRARDEGLIRHVAFSFHDTPENLIRLIDTGCYESVTVQYNLLDQRNRDAIAHADEAGMGVVVMGPVGGGRLGLPSTAISGLVGEEVCSTAEAALRFVWGTRGVHVALSGMQNLEMLEENVATAENCEPFAEATVTTLNELVRERKEKSGLYCTGCGYCTPRCPSGVSIPENLDLVNLAAIYDLHDSARERYQWLGGKAAACTGCGRCVAACPQKIDIPSQLRKAALMFDEGAGTAQLDAVIDELLPDGRFVVRLHVYNFSDSAGDYLLKVNTKAGIEIRPDTFRIEGAPAFARLTRTAEGTFMPESDELSFCVENRAGHTTAVVRKRCRFAFAYPYAAIHDNWSSGEWYEFLAGRDDFSEAKETSGLHGVRFRLSYDETRLLLSAEVRDDFLYPTVRKSHEGAEGDCLELLLDGRAHERPGTRGTRKGVHRVFLFPGTPGKAPPFYKAPRTDMRIKLRADSTRAGYRLTAAIPFFPFCAGTAPPKRIGFHLACHSADRHGRRIATFAWDQQENEAQGTLKLRDLWLV